MIMNNLERIEALTQENILLAASLKKADAEWDELAAHVERLRNALYNLSPDSPRTFEQAQAAKKEQRAALAETPQTSLARRDALKQAEALETLYNDLSGQGMVRRGVLLDRVIEIQSQAEGASDD